MSQKHVNSLLDEFDVDNEEALRQKMAEDALTIPCCVCMKEFEPDSLYWADGEPYCKTHYEEEFLYD